MKDKRANGQVTNSHIIIDASYIRGMSKDGAPLRTMCEQGGRIVITDTLMFELCSTNDSNQWNASRRKLVEYRDAVDVWEHVSVMWKDELIKNRPYGKPLHPEGTRRFREMLANNPQYEPDDLDKRIERTRQQREDPSLPELFQNFAKLSKEPEFKEVAERIRDKSPHDDEVVRISSAVINDPQIIRSVINVIRFTTENDMAVSLDPKDVNEKWVIWHFSRSLLTMLCDCLRRGDNAFSRLSKRLRKRLNNARHDLDYLTLLPFADAIASCEKKGEMSYYRRWMFGDYSKLLIRCYENEQIARGLRELRQMHKIAILVHEQLNGYKCVLAPRSQASLKTKDSETLPESVFVARDTKRHFELFSGSTWKHTVEILTGYSVGELRVSGGVVFVNSETMETLFDPVA